jgi:membrane protease YdiL (CAAX protease family)
MKAKSIIEVLLVFILMKFFSIWLDSILVNADVDSGWRTFFFGLQAIIIPVAIIGFSGRKWSTYGLSLKDSKSQIHYGFAGAMIMMILGLGFGFLKSRGISTSGRTGSIVMSLIAIIMIALFVFIFRKSKKNDKTEKKLKIRLIYQLSILLIMIGSPIVAALIKRNNVQGIIAWDLYFLIMVGFGEEIKFRGYFQSRINEGYGRPWKFFGISFGPGLLIVSLLFGLSHIIQFGVFNPFLGQYNINPWMGLQAFFGGFFYGIIREKSESIVSSGIAHGVPNAFGQVLSMALR